MLSPDTFRLASARRAWMNGKRLHLCSFIPLGPLCQLREEDVDPMALGLCKACGEPVDNAPALLGDPR